MGSKSKRRHAQKQYNRAQNKPVVPTAQTPDANTVVDANTTVTSASPIMTPKELRRAAKEKAKQEKRLQKEQAKANPNQAKSKKDKEKKPFFLIRFFRWIARGISSIASELKKVHWPTFKQICKSTGVVLGIVIAFGLLLFVIWIVLGLLHYLLVNGNLDGWSIM